MSRQRAVESFMGAMQRGFRRRGKSRKQQEREEAELHARSMRGKIFCPTCEGRGYDADLRDCPTCGGDGKVPAPNPKRSASAQKLVEAFGRLYGFRRMGGGSVQVEQRLYDAYMKQRNALLHKVGLQMFSREDQAQLEAAAEAWWNAKVMKGPGVDW